MHTLLTKLQGALSLLMLVSSTAEASTPPPFQTIQLPFNDQHDILCFKNGAGLKEASGPTGWWANRTGACTGMSLVVGAALTNSHPTRVPERGGMPISDRYALSARLARMGCPQKVQIPVQHTLFSSCSAESAEFSDLVTQQNATKVISEISPAVIDRFLNTGHNSRQDSLEALKRIYRELRAGRPALLVIQSKTGSLPHTVLVTGIESSAPAGRDPAVILRVYDSNWSFEGPYWPSASRVLIPFEKDWSLPKTQAMTLIGFAQYLDPEATALDEQLLAYPLWDEKKGAPSVQACCALVQTNASVFDEADRSACKPQESESLDPRL